MYKILEDQQIHFGFINVTLLHSGRQYVSTSHVAILMAVRKRVQMQLYCV
jgi:hypothetical protein